MTDDDLVWEDRNCFSYEEMYICHVTREIIVVDVSNRFDERHRRIRRMNFGIKS